MWDKPKDDRAWSGKTGGTRSMQLSLIRIFRHLPPATLYPVVCLWVIGYILFVPSTWRGQMQYWRLREKADGRRPHCLWRVWNAYMTNLEFGKAILDRFAAYAGRHIDVHVEGQDILDRLNSQDEGFIVLSSHLGNQELAGYTFEAHKPMAVVTYLGDTETVNDNRRRLFEQMGLTLLPVREDGSHVLEMHNALSRGEILSIHGDRLFYRSKAMRATILGKEAPYPEGPFRIAAAEQVPVVSLFFMRERVDTYTLYVRELSNGQMDGIRRQDRAAELLRRYVQANEEILARYPRQWFHFFPFWGK